MFSIFFQTGRNKKSQIIYSELFFGFVCVKQLNIIEHEHICIVTLLDLTSGSISTSTLLSLNAFISLISSSLELLDVLFSSIYIQTYFLIILKTT